VVAYRAEVWQLPHESPWGRLHPRLLYSHLVCQIESSDVGYGRLTFQGSDSTLITKVIDTSNDHGSIIRVFDDEDSNVFTFFAESLEQLYEEDGAPTTVVHGQGIASILDKMVIQPFSGLDGVHPNWQWGGEDQNLLRNADAEATPFPNSGFEDGDTGYWDTTENDDLFNPATLVAVKSSIDARSGDWYGLVNPNGTTSGVRRTLQGLLRGETYTITGYLNEPLGLGERFRAGVSGAASSSHTNAYVEDDIHWAELGNATQGNGSSTGVYQLTTLTFVAGADQVELFIVYEGAADPNFLLDDWNISGDNVGIEPWEAYALQSSTMNFARYTTAQAHSGGASIEFQGVDRPYLSQFGIIGYGTIGLWQDISVTIGKTYTGSAWVRHNGASAVYLRLIWSRNTPKGELSTTTFGNQLPGPGSSYMKSTTVLISPNTWTKIQMTGKTDVSSLKFRVAFAGSLAKTDVGDFTSPTIWVDDAAMFEGLPATTTGDILQSIITPIQDRGVGDWLDISTWAAATDSNNVAWDLAERAMDIPPGQTVLQLLDSFVELGYEWTVVWNGTAFSLRVYNPEGLGVDHGGTLTFHPREGWRPTVWQESLPPYTAVLAEGDQGIYSYGEDAGLLAGYGRWEGSLFLSGVGITQSANLDQWIAQELNRVITQRFAARAEMIPTKRFGSDWGLGDKVVFAFNNTPFGEKEERIATVQIVCTDEDEQNVTYSVDFVKAVLLEPLGGTTSAPTSYMLNKLLRKFRKRIEVPKGGVPFGGGDVTGIPTIFIACSDAHPNSKVVAHYQFDGENDVAIYELALQSILDDAPTTGGRIVISEGHFYIDPAFNGTYGTRVTDRIHLMGMGAYRTFIVNQGNGTAGNALIEVQTDGEMSDIGFDTVTGFVGRVVKNDYGRLSNLFFQGPCESALYLNGTQQPISDIVVNSTPSDACIVIDEGWVALNNVVSLRAGSGGAFMRITNGATTAVTINNLVVSHQPGVGNGIEIESISEVVLSNFAIVTPGNIGILVDASTPFWANISNGFIRADYGISWAGSPGFVHSKISNLLIVPDLIGIDMKGMFHSTIENVSMYQPGQHGIRLTDCSDNELSKIRIYRPGLDLNNTYDGIILEGNSDRNTIQINRILSAPTSPKARFGINISASTCNDNVVVGNNLRPSANFGTDALNDAGTGTVLQWPSDSIYGSNITDGAGSGGAGAQSNAATFSQVGDLVVGVGTFKLPFTLDAEIISVALAVGTSPTGADLIVDINKNGVTLFTTQANRPRIVDADADGVGAEAVPDVTSISEGQYLTVDIDQIGSTLAGADLTVVIEWRPV